MGLVGRPGRVVVVQAQAGGARPPMSLPSWPTTKVVEVGDVAVGARRAGRRAARSATRDAGQGAGEVGAESKSPARRCRAHDDVADRSVDDAGEGLAQGVGEDERPGHERHAEDDGEGAHEQPQLAGEQALPGGAQHRVRHPCRGWSVSRLEALHALEDPLGGGLAQLVDDPAVGEEHDAVGVGRGARVVGHHDDGLAEGRRRSRRRKPEHLGARGRVEVAGGLVGEDDLGPARPGPGRRRPAAAGRRTARSAGGRAGRAGRRCR